MTSAVVVLDRYANTASGQRALLAHFKGTEHKITQLKLTALLNGDGFKDWEEYPQFMTARTRARAKADRQNPNGSRPRTPDESDDVVTYKRNSPSSVYCAKVRLDKVWNNFDPDERERVTLAARDAGGDPAK